MSSSLGGISVFNSGPCHQFPGHKLKPAIAELGGKQIIQAGASYHPVNSRQGQLRHELEDEVSDAAYTAVTITEETGDTALQAHFRLPGSHSDSALIATARSMAAAIRTHELNAAFESHGWPADTATHLAILAKAFEQSEGGQGSTLGQQVEATASIPGVIRRGAAAIHAMTTIFRRVYKGRPEVLAAWKSATHIEKSPKSPPQPPEGTPPGTDAPSAGT